MSGLRSRHLQQKRQSLVRRRYVAVAAASFLLVSTGAAVAAVNHGPGSYQGWRQPRASSTTDAQSQRTSWKNRKIVRAGTTPPAANPTVAVESPAPAASVPPVVGSAQPTKAAEPSVSPTAPAASAPAPVVSSPPAAPAPVPAASSPAAPPPAAPPVVSGSCVGSNNAPGSPDPWGGCWPGPQNTGYPKGLPGDTRTPVTLGTYTGPKDITSCGVVIDSKIVNGDLVISGGNGTHSAATPCVTIKNSLVKGTIHTDNTGDGPVVISDTEVDAPADSYWASIGFYNTFTYRVNSHGGQGTIKCQAYCESHDSWVHGMDLNLQYHYNAFGGNGIEAADATFVINHGYADCGGFDSKTSNVGSDAGCSADIGFYGDFAPIRNITINKTYFAPSRPNAQFGGGTQPGYCLNPGYYPGKPYPNPSNVVVTNNVFARGPNGKCGEYGASNTFLKGSGNAWSGNTYDDGSAIGAP